MTEQLPFKNVLGYWSRPDNTVLLVVGYDTEKLCFR